VTSQTSDRHLWWLLPLLLFALYAISVAISFGKLDVRLGDSDDALRLVQVKEFLATGSWFDLHLKRLAPPEGLLSHWSRIPDVLMAIVHFIASAIVETDRAEFWMRALYPGLWIVPVFIASSSIAKDLTGSLLAPLAVFLFVACNPITFHQFMAGRIDHHGAQIALSVAVLAVLAQSINRPVFGFAGGALTALCLAIGLEALPHLLVPAIALAVLYIWTGQGHASLRSYAAALAIAAFVMWLAALPLSNLMVTACDAFAGNMAIGLMAGGVVLTAALVVQKTHASLAQRLLTILIAGAAAGITYIWLDPTCIKGPFAATSAELKLRWLNEVNEMQPVLPFSKPDEILENLKYFTFFIPAVISAFFLMRLPRYRESFAFWTLLAGFAVSVVIGLSALRMTHYVIWLAAPLLAAAVFEFAKSTLSWRKATILGVAVSPVVFVILPVLAAQPFIKADPVRIAKAACLETARFDALKTLPPGLVLAEPNLGPFILANTEHSVVAAPYHRIGQSILFAQDFFSAADQQMALSALKRSNVTYVVICRTNKLPNGVRPGGIYESILKGKPPSWLSPVAAAPTNPVEAYRVNR
jgi:hypothetical protein